MTPAISASGTPEPKVGAYPSSAQAWTGCAILTAGCILAYMDRGILSLFVLPMQRDLHLSDTQVSLLIGLAFSLFNAMFGLPVGRLVDLGNRKLIAAGGIAIWSVASALCGLASSFGQLFAARIGVGAGEGAVTPAAVSLLADFFPPHRRGLPVGIFYSGMYLGLGGVMLAGGWIWHTLGDRVLTVPLLGERHSWQLILIGFAGLGAIVAPITLAMKEPRRLGQQSGSLGNDRPSLAAVVAFYRANTRTLIGHNLGFCLQNFPLHAGMAWLPAILMRTQGWSLAEIGLVYGAMTITLSPAGAIFAGGFADRLAARGWRDSRLVVAMTGALATSLACAAIGIFHAPVAAIGAIMGFSFFAPFCLPLGPGALQEIMPNAMRGQATAIYAFVINILAGSMAATFVALLTDKVFHDPLRVNQAFAIVGIAGSLGAFALYAVTRAPFRALRDRQQGICS